jgi:hypothetical protein
MIRFCCPSCKAVLEHAAPGATVGCPTCGQPLEVPAAVPEEQLPEVILLPEGESRRPPRPRRGGKYCPECGADVHPRDRYCPDCDTRLGRPRRDYEPHRGTLVMVLGILSLVVMPIILGPIAWYMATDDLKKIRAGRMDPEGESQTNTGRVCGMVGTILGIVGLVIMFFFFVIWLSVFSAVVGSRPHR